ncbi:MAG: DUF4149 domain-containing protein [Gammaproteobacteria bacterium]|nr:DUF4149 domain-containing protein [Gammaproteobacteria bacterium]MDE2348387.1 DUF4149 domain-containing protein [Gammaproteobacteria bacterium]
MTHLRGLFRVLLVFAIGSLWSLAAGVAPILFFTQPNRHLAGELAGRMFRIETYLCVAVALIALALPGRTRFGWWYLVAILLSINEWVLRPRMELARVHGVASGLSFGAWHGVSAILYLVACAAAVLLVWKDDLR